MMKLGTSDVPAPSAAHIHFRGEKHADQRGSEINPQGRPMLRAHRRGKAARWINANAGERSFKRNKTRYQSPRPKAGKFVQPRMFRDSQNPRHKNEGNYTLSAKRCDDARHAWACYYVIN